MNPTLFTPANELEKSLMILPKDCNCSACQAQKNKAKEQLGTKKYYKVCESIGIK